MEVLTIGLAKISLRKANLFNADDANSKGILKPYNKIQS
jgi:hypothetical protein